MRFGVGGGGGGILTEGCGDADDETFARGELFGKIDLIARGTFDEVDVGDGITGFDHVDGCLMEGSDGFICCLKKCTGYASSAEHVVCLYLYRSRLMYVEWKRKMTQA